MMAGSGSLSLPLAAPLKPSVRALPAAASAQPCTQRRRLAVAAAGQQAAVAAAAGVSEAQVRADVTRKIKKLGREGKPREAVAELAAMARLGVQPDTLAATALVDACARNGKMDMARSVFDELFGSLLTPDEVVYAVLLRGYGGAARPNWNEMSSCLTEMESKHGITPSTVTYNALLECCCKTNDEERAEEIVNRMLLAGVQPDSYTLEAVRPKRSMRSLLKRAFDITF